MTRIIALTLACLSLGGCAGVGDFLNSEQSDKSIGARILKDIQGCSRRYTGGLGAGVTGSFTIVCDPIVKDGFHVETAKGPAT